MRIWHHPRAIRRQKTIDLVFAQWELRLGSHYGLFVRKEGWNG